MPSPKQPVTPTALGTESPPAIDKKRQKKTASSDAVFKAEKNPSLIHPSGCGQGIDIHPAPFPVEPDVAVHQRKNSVVAAQTYVLPRGKLGAPLPDDNVTRNNGLAAELFHTKPFAVAVATILY